MTLPFDFTIAGPPVSQQARRSERIEEWRDAVQAAANRLWLGAPPVESVVMVTVIYFHDGRRFDVDNIIPKPILDALNGLVFSDDNQVTDLVCHKLDLDDRPRVVSQSEVLNKAIDNGGQFLHIVVESAAAREVVSWHRTRLLPKAASPR